MLKGTMIFCINDSGRILLGEKRNSKMGNGTLNVPGGTRENRESFKRCAKRELFEETEISVREKQLIFSGTITFFVGNNPDFLVKIFVLKGNYEPKDSHTMFNFKWFDTNKIPFEKMLDGDKHFFPELIEKIKDDKKINMRVYYEKREGRGYKRYEIDKCQ